MKITNNNARAGTGLFIALLLVLIGCSSISLDNSKLLYVWDYERSDDFGYLDQRIGQFLRTEIDDDNLLRSGIAPTWSGDYILISFSKAFESSNPLYNSQYLFARMHLPHGREFYDLFKFSNYAQSEYLGDVSSHALDRFANEISVRDTSIGMSTGMDETINIWIKNDNFQDKYNTLSELDKPPFSFKSTGSPYEKLCNYAIREIFRSENLQFR